MEEKKKELQQLIRLILKDCRGLTRGSDSERYIALKEKIDKVKEIISGLSPSEKKEILSENITANSEIYGPINEAAVSGAVLLQLSSAVLLKLQKNLKNDMLSNQYSMSKYVDDMPKVVNEINSIKSAFEEYSDTKISLEDINDEILDNLDANTIEFQVAKVNDYEYIEMKFISDTSYIDNVRDSEHYNIVESDSSYVRSLPLYKESLKKIDEARKGDYDKILNYLTEVMNRYFNMDLMPKSQEEYMTFDEVLKDNPENYKIRDILNELYDAYVEHYMFSNDKNDVEFIKSSGERILSKLKEELYNNKDFNVSLEQELHAKEVQAKMNNISFEYFENGFPYEYQFDEKLRDKNCSKELKEALKEIVHIYRNTKFSNLVDYYKKMEPYVEKVYEEIEKSKSNNIPEKLQQTKIEYENESFFGKLKEKIFNKNKTKK